MYSHCHGSDRVRSLYMRANIPTSNVHTVYFTPYLRQPPEPCHSIQNVLIIPHIFAQKKGQSLKKGGGHNGEAARGGAGLVGYQATR